MSYILKTTATNSFKKKLNFKNLIFIFIELKKMVDRAKLKIDLAKYIEKNQNEITTLQNLRIKLKTRKIYLRPILIEFQKINLIEEIGDEIYRLK
jgi:hypothetical protein